jgi:hypothetical protein
VGDGAMQAFAAHQNQSNRRSSKLSIRIQDSHGLKKALTTGVLLLPGIEGEGLLLASQTKKLLLLKFECKNLF